MARYRLGLIAALVLVPAAAAATPVRGLEPRAACTAPTALPPPPAGRPHYVLTVKAAEGLRDVSGTMSVAFAPEVATDRIVFRLWPNSPYYAQRGAHLVVGAVAAAGRKAATSRPDPTTLVVLRPLAAHERIVVSAAWRLRLPRTAGLQLHGGRGARLVSFFPLLAWNGSGWATDPPVPLDSFWSTSPTADFDVRIVVPKGLGVLATGEPRSGGRWHARAARDFALAIGRFKTLATTIAAPRRVRVTVGLERGSSYSVRFFLDQATRALRFYAARYGDYPWSTYSLAVMRDYDQLNGTSYPTLTFLGDASLVLVPHETAHQWFLSLVGNDQYRDPWLSEGLATWAQTGPEGSLSQMVTTPVSASVRNRIGEPMSFWAAHDFETMRLGLYVQSAQALASLGSTSTVNCALRAFVVRNAYRTASPADLLTALRPFFPDAEQKLVARGAHF
jgi:hypothetical protein